MSHQKKALRILAGGIFFVGLALAFFLALSGGNFLYTGFWSLILGVLATSAIVGGLLMAGIIGKSLGGATLSTQQEYQPRQEVPTVFQKELARYL